MIPPYRWLATKPSRRPIAGFYLLGETMRISKSIALAGTCAQGDKAARKIANNTFRYHRPSDGAEIIRLHTTDIIEKFPDGRVRLNSGGWQTVTTKERFNSLADAYAVYSVKGEWFVSRQGQWDKRVPFFDGIMLPDDLDNPPPADPAPQAQAKAIRAFVRQLDKLETLPLPDNGDCLLCCMGQTSCLPSHVEENYLHGSLLVAAMRWAGFQDPGIALYFHGLGSRATVKSALRRYMRRHMGLPA